MNNVRINKSIISLLIIFTVIFSSFAISPSVSAFNFPKISCGSKKKPETWGKLWNYTFYGNFFKNKCSVKWGQTYKSILI